jgi:WD40-like Beta Propeller Repeat
MRRRVMGNAERRASCGGCRPARVLGAAGVCLLVGAIASVPSPVRADDCSSGVVTTRVSIGNDGAEANGRSELAAVNADGCVVAFKSAASNLIANDGNGLIDVFVRDRKAGTTERIPVKPYVGPDPNAISYPPALDADGGVVIFGSEASNLVSGDFNASPDLFAYDRTLNLTSILTLVLDVNGQGRGGGRVPDLPPSVCADGSLAAFTSSAADLVSGDGNEANDVFVRNRITGTIELISVSPVGGGGHAADGPSAGGAISGDGCTVAFYSDATNLVPDDTNEVRDVFARDRCAGTTERVSVATSGAQANGPSQASGGLPAVSADGRYVAFASDASNLVAGDTNGVTDIFLRDTCIGAPAGCVPQTLRISVATDGGEANGPSDSPSISADGRFIAFDSAAANLVPDGSSAPTGAYLRDTCFGAPAGCVPQTTRLAISSPPPQ